MGSTRYFVILLGWCSVSLGIVGIFLPLIPTTPFLLLAAWCFSRSSPTFHNWLMTHPKLGPIITTWNSGDGLPVKVRNRIILVMWASMILSMLIIGKLWSAVLLTAIGTSVTIYIMRKPVIY